MAGVELEKYAIDMSYKQSEKQSLETQHKAGDPLGGIPSLSTTLQLHFSALHHLYLGPF